MDVDETVGLGDYQAQSPLTWKGKTEIRPKIVWADPASRPWNDITLLISTLVRIEACPRSATARHCVVHVTGPSRAFCPPLPGAHPILTFPPCCDACRYSHLRECLQPCDEDDAQLVKDAQVYAPAGGGKPYEWPLNVMDEGITSPAGVTDVTLHFYDEGSIVDTDQAKCAVFVQGAQPNRKIIARGARPAMPPHPALSEGRRTEQI